MTKQTAMDKLKAQLKTKRTPMDVLEDLGLTSDQAQSVSEVAEIVHSLLDCMHCEQKPLKFTIASFALQYVIMQQLSQFRIECGEEAADDFLLTLGEFMMTLHKQLRSKTQPE